MRWRNRSWSERTPRPKAVKLPREALQRLRDRAARFVEESLILRELLDEVQLATVLKVLKGDAQGTFHGLGSLVAKQREGKPSAQVVLHRDFKIPVRVLAEPRYWYSMHPKPAITEVNGAKDRVLVRFVTYGISGSFHETCLYALRDGKWG